MHYQSLLKRALIFVTLLTMFGCGNDENTIQTVDLSPNETTVKAAKQQIQIGDDDYTVTIKVIINEATGANRYDFGTASIDVPFVDQVVLFSGSSQVDEIIIAPGNVYDLTNTKGSSDRIILDRQYVEYIDNIALDALTGNLIIKHQVGTNAQTILHVGVSRTAADILVFADGAVSTAAIKQALRVQQSLTNVVIDTTLTSQNVTSTTTNSAQVKMLAMTDEAVEFIPLSANSMHQVSGSSGVDKVFVSPTASMALTNLKGSQDEIFFAGTWEQYRKQINVDGTMTFSLVQSGVTLSEVTLTTGRNVANNDLLIFADGAVPIANAYVALQNNLNSAFDAIGGRDVTTLSRVDRERIDSDNDGVADAFDIAPFDASRSAQLDSDGDGVPDDIDVAPNDASIAKAIRFNLSNVANVGITESVAQPTTGENVFLKQRKVSENAFISQAYANDDITTLANTSNAKTFDQNGGLVADAILSSSPFFVAETVVTPNGRYAYLITSPRLQESISGLPTEVCNLYVVTLSDNSFECALERSQPEPTPIQLIENSRVWFDLKGIQFREDNTGLFNHGDDVYLMAPDFSLSKLPYNVSTEDYYYLTGYGWLDDDHIFMVMGCGAENCGALVLSAINVNTLQEVATVSRGENSGDGLIDFGQVSQLNDTIFVGSRAVRWTGTDFEAAQGGGIEAVVDQYGRSWAYEDNYDVGMPPKKLASIDGTYSINLSQRPEININDRVFSGSGSGVVYKNFVFEEDYVLHKYGYEAKTPIQSVNGQPYAQSTLYSLSGDQGYVITDNRFAFFYYLPKSNTSGDVAIPYTVKNGEVTEERTFVIPAQAIANYLSENPEPKDPNLYTHDFREITDGPTIRFYNPEPDSMGFCLYQLSTSNQQCALLEDYASITYLYDAMQHEAYFPEGSFECPNGNCGSGIQNLVFVGQSIYVYFRDDTDGQFYQATATINDFMQDGESALTFTPVTNTAGESEIMSGANALKLFSQSDIANVTASYTNQQLIIDFKQTLALQAQLPRFRVFAGEQSILVYNAKVNPVKPSELIIDLDLGQLSIGTEYSVEMLDFVFIAAKSGRYSIESALTFTAVDDTGLYQDDDNDGVINKFDAYPNISLDGLADSDQDGIPDVCNRSCQQRGMVTDYDTDGDGYYNGPSLNIYSFDADKYDNWPALNENRGYGQSFIAKGPVTSIGLELDPSVNFAGGLKLYLYDYESKALLSTVIINETEGNILSGLTIFPINNIGEANQKLIFMVHSTTNDSFNVLGGSNRTNNYGEGAFYSLSNISETFENPEFVASNSAHDTKVTVQYAPQFEDAHPDDATQWLAQPAVSGKVIDGYIQGATVYLDLDYDGIIDSGEPSTVTTANGDYTLLLSDAQEACTSYAPLRVNVPVGAVDQDLGEVTKAYQMVLPPNLNILQDGYDFNITPLSTVLWEQIHSYFEEEIGSDLSCEIVRDNVNALSDVESSISSAIQNVVTHYNIPADQIFADFIANNNSTLVDKAQLIVKGLQKSFAETQTLKDTLAVGDFAEVRYFVFSSMDGDELYPNAWYREIQKTFVDGDTFVELYKISDDLETNVRLIYRAERSSGSSTSNSNISFGLNKEIESRGGDDSAYQCNYQESLNVYDGSKQYEVVNLTSHTSSSNDLGECTFDSFENSTTSRYIFTPEYVIGDATYSAQFTFDYQYSKNEFPNVTDFAQFIDDVDSQVVISYVDSLPDEFCSENDAGAQSVVRSKNYSEGGNQITVTRQGNHYTKKVTYPDGTSDETSYGAEDTAPVDDCVEVSEPPVETPTEQDQCGKYCEESVGLFYYHYALTSTPKTFPIHLGGNDIRLEFAGGASTGSFKFIDESDNEHLAQSPNIDSDHPFLSALKSNPKELTLATNGDNPLDNSFRIYRDNNLIGMINLVRDVGDTVSDIQLSHTKAIINRLSADSGSRANDQCSEFGMNDYAAGISHHGQISLVPNNVVVGDTMDLLGVGGENSFYVCDDTPLGTYNINMTAIDGVGGQASLSMQIQVVEPTVDGGQLTWAQADYLGAGDNCDNAYCYEYDDTLMVFNAIGSTPHTYSFSFSDDVVFGESSSPQYINFNHSNQDYVLTNIAPECLGTDVRECDNWNKGFDADVLGAFNGAINSGTVTMYSDYPHLTDEMFANVDGKRIRLTFIKDTGQEVSTLGDFSDDLVVYPVLEGTGTRDDNQCHEFDLYAINQDFNSSIRVLAESNDLFGVTSARKITPCSDWVPGHHQIQLTAIDGLGGKKHVGTLNIEVKSEKVKQGRVMKRDCGANCVATSYGYMSLYSLTIEPQSITHFMPSANRELSSVSRGGNPTFALTVIENDGNETILQFNNFDDDWIKNLFNQRKSFAIKHESDNDLVGGLWLRSENDYIEGQFSFNSDKVAVVDGLKVVNDTVTVNRPTDGSGNRSDSNYQCSQHHMGNFVNKPLNNSGIILVPKSQVPIGTMPLLSFSQDNAITICSDTLEGQYDVEFIALDGKGGKKALQLTIDVASERVDGGSLTWSNDREFLPYIRISGNSDWVIYDCCGGSTLIPEATDPEKGSVPHFYVANGNDGTILGFTTLFEYGGQGNPINVSSIRDTGYISFDFKYENAPDVGNSGWLLRVYSRPDTSEYVEVNLTNSLEGLTPSESWQTFTFKLSDLWPSGSLDLNNIHSIAIFPTWGQGDDAIYQVANLQFTAPAGMKAFNSADIYLRNSLDDWDTSTRFNYSGNGIYTANLDLTSGEEIQFKVSGSDWSNPNLGAPYDGDLAIASENSSFKLATTHHNVKFTADLDTTYKFVFDVFDEDQPTLTILSSGIYSDSSFTLISNGEVNEDWALWDCCGGSTPGLVADDVKGQVAEFKVENGNSGTVLGFITRSSDGGNDSPIDVTPIANNGVLSFDLKVQNAPAAGNEGWMLKIESNSDQEEFVEVNLNTSNEGENPSENWQTFTFDISDLTNNSSLVPSGIDAIMIFPTWGTGADTVYRIDNMLFTGETTTSIDSGGSNNNSDNANTDNADDNTDTVNNPTTSLISDVGYVDSNIQSCIASQSEQQGWSNVSEVTSINCADVQNIDDLKYFKNLERLILSFDKDRDVDLSAIRSLTKLDDLYLESPNSVTDLSPLSSLDNLSSLMIIHAPAVKDFNFLRNLSNLSSLVLVNTPGVADELSLFNSLANLDSLGIYDSGLTELGSITELGNLSFLGLAVNRIFDFGGLENLNNLKVIALPLNPIRHFNQFMGLSPGLFINPFGLPLLSNECNSGLLNSNRLLLLSELPDACFVTDFDNDLIDDDYENEFNLNPQDSSDALIDSDGDGFYNLQEYHAGTAPNDTSDFPILLADIIIDNHAFSSCVNQQFFAQGLEFDTDIIKLNCEQVDEFYDIDLSLFRNLIEVRLTGTEFSLDSFETDNEINSPFYQLYLTGFSSLSARTDADKISVNSIHIFETPLLDNFEFLSSFTDVKEFSFSTISIDTLQGFEHLTSLEKLSLYGEIKDLNVIRKLVEGGLKEIDLQGLVNAPKECLDIFVEQEIPATCFLTDSNNNFVADAYEGI